MSDIVDAVEMPDQDGKSPGDLWYGLPINPTLATHVWNGREWRPLLTEEDYYKAEITALRAEVERLRAALREYECHCPTSECEWFPCGRTARNALEKETSA